MKKVFSRNLATGFFVALILFTVVVNLLVIFPAAAHAIPVKRDWVWMYDATFHCESAQENHCWPGSAFTF